MAITGQLGRDEANAEALGRLIDPQGHELLNVGSGQLVELRHADRQLIEHRALRLAESAEKVLQLFALRGFESVGQFIEKGIQSANLGLNPTVQGRFIRIVLPDLSAERRLEMVKIAKRMAEEGRHDRARTPGHGAEMRDRIAGSRLEIIEDAGHTPHLEQPDNFHRIALPFLVADR